MFTEEADKVLVKAHITNRMVDFDLNGVETWVRKWANGKKLSPAYYPTEKKLKIGKNSVSTVFGTESVFQTLLAVSTQPDGDCLVHSFLTCTSETYRQLPKPSKGKCGHEFRLQLATQVTDVTQKKRWNNNAQYLQDNDMDWLSNTFKVHIFCIATGSIQRRKTAILLEGVQDIEQKKWPWIGILSLNGIPNQANAQQGHFEALKFGTQWMLPYDQLMPVYTKYSGFEAASVRLGLPIGTAKECAFDNGDKVQYKGKQYTITDRHWKDLKCDTLELIDENGLTLTKVPVQDVKSIAASSVASSSSSAAISIGSSSMASSSSSIQFISSSNSRKRSLTRRSPPRSLPRSPPRSPAKKRDKNVSSGSVLKFLKQTCSKKCADAWKNHMLKSN